MFMCLEFLLSIPTICLGTPYKTKMQRDIVANVMTNFGGRYKGNTVR